MTHAELVTAACMRALDVLDASSLKFRPMQRKNHVNTRRGFVVGRTNIKTGLITIDIFTPKLIKPKKVSAILRILCHEVAHHQKKPYRQRYRGHIITRSHYPIFYRQVTRNIKKLKRAGIL